MKLQSMNKRQSTDCGGHNIPFECIQLTSREDAQHAPCAFTTYGAFYNGKFLTHEILSAKKFEKVMLNMQQI